MKKTLPTAPVMRFYGFADLWEQRTLGDLAEVNPRSVIPEKFEYVDLESVVGTEIIAHRTETRESAPSRAQRLAKKGDVFYQTVRPYQKNNCLFDGGEGSYVFSTGYAQLRSHGDSYFLLTMLQCEEFVNNVLDRCTGTSYPAINANVLAGLIISYPVDIQEQKKIGQYFKSLDNLITLHQRKLDQLKTLKKYFLQNMFPAKGEKVPKIRMKGFTGDWEEQKINNVIEVYTKKTTIEDQYPVLTSSQQKGIILQNEYFSGEWVSKNGNVGYFIIPRGYFAYRSRSDNDVFVFNRNDAVDIGIISYFYPVFKPKGVDSNFLLERLNYGIEKQIMLNSEGTGQHVLSLKKFKNISALFPSYEEQKLIGYYFQRIEKIIELYQCKLDEICTLKKYMIQNMFI